MNNATKLEESGIPNLIECVKTAPLETLEMSLKMYPNAINRQDDMGLTALHWAAHLRNYAAVRALLGTLKADLTIRDSNNKSIMDHALTGGHERIINLILQHQEFYGDDTPD